MQCDDCDQATAQTIIQQQANSAQREQIAHHILMNDGSLSALKERILKFHQDLLKTTSSTF